MRDLRSFARLGEPRAHRFETRQLLRGVRIGGLVGHGQVRPEALEAQLLMRADELCERVGRLGCRSDAVHPGVDLEVYRERAGAVLRDRLGEGLDTSGGVHRGRETGCNDRGRGRRYRFREHEDGRVDSGLAELDALFHECDAEHRRAGFDGRPPGRDRAVAVAVGLDDREHPGRRGDPAQLGDVGP